MDFDGHFEYSKVVSIEVQNQDLLIYPNPVSDFLTIKNLDKKVAQKVKIFNSLGQVVFSEKINLSEEKIDLSNLRKGNYVLEISNRQGVVSQRRIIKVSEE